MLPGILRDVDEYLGDGRSVEHFFGVISELLAVDVHVQLKLDVLRSVYLVYELNDHLVRFHLVKIEVGSVRPHGSRARISCADYLQLELQASAGGDGAAHCEKVRGDADQLAGNGDEVDRVG